MVECVEGISDVSIPGSENASEVSSLLQNPSSLPDAVKDWFHRITDENVIGSMAPLAGVALNDEVTGSRLLSMIKPEVIQFSGIFYQYRHALCRDS